MNKLGKKIAAASLCLCLTAATLTGCAPKADKTVVTVDGTKASYGLVNFMLRFNQAQMQSIYGAFMGESMWENYGETTKSSVVQSLEDMMLLEGHMEDYQVSLSEEEKTKISEAAKAFVADNEEKTLKAMNGDVKNVERMLTLYTIQSKMYNAIIEDVDTNVTDEEAAQKTVQYVLFSIADSTDAEGNTVEMTDEEKTEKKEQAEKLLKEVKAGTDMAEALKEIDEDRTPTTSSYGKENGSLAEEVKAEAEKLSDGEVADSVIETDGGYYVLKMVSTFDKEKTEAQKDTIISQRKSDKYTEVLDSYKEGAAISTDSDLLSSMDFLDTYELKGEETETSAETESGSVTEAGTEEATDKGTEAGSETGKETETAGQEETTEEKTTESASTEMETTEAGTTEAK